MCKVNQLERLPQLCLLRFAKSFDYFRAFVNEFNYTSYILSNVGNHVILTFCRNTKGVLNRQMNKVR